MHVWHCTATCERAIDSFSRLTKNRWTFLDLFVISRTVRNFRDPDEQQWMCQSAMRPWDSWGVASHRGLGRMSSIKFSVGSGSALGMLNDAGVVPVMADAMEHT